MEIVYSREKTITGDQLAAIFDRSGIRRPTGDRERIARMAASADLLITAWDGDRLVGVARSITDFCYACYLSDLAVDHEYQKNGIGTELIKQTHAIVGEECVLLLISAPTAMSFYEKIGLEPVTKCWMIPRKK
jgi:GNAT superfamily N-acetyltransferase